ncbi:MAG: FAD:protein FMN transferase [Crocinitomix sp.]|nr:FAD:protein FMN transferase [Crocinitomix sp.]
MKHYYLLLFIPFLILSCGGDSTLPDTENNGAIVAEPLELYGSTQGTTFAIICNDSISITMDEVNQILSNFDDALSSYIPNSILTKLNEAGAGVFVYQDTYNYFNRCYEMALSVHELTEGAFDPSVYPLVDGWGFMKDLNVVPDSTTVDSLRALLGFQNGYHFNFSGEVTQDSLATSTIVKNTPSAKLDFNAIAQGLAVDVLAETLEKRGAKNYFVEIGGEIRVKGNNADGVAWRIGIDKPVENSDEQTRELQEIVSVENKSIATSGSYRKFYEKNGIKYSHTLDPLTGYPVTHSLLSATVVTESCAMADAMATAFMVMGPEKAIAFIEENSQLGLDVYLIFINEYDEYETYYTPRFGKMIEL